MYHIRVIVSVLLSCYWNIWPEPPSSSSSSSQVDPVYILTVCWADCGSVWGKTGLTYSAASALCVCPSVQRAPLHSSVPYTLYTLAMMVSAEILDQVEPQNSSEARGWLVSAAAASPSVPGPCALAACFSTRAEWNEPGKSCELFNSVAAARAAN